MKNRYTKALLFALVAMALMVGLNAMAQTAIEGQEIVDNASTVWTAVKALVGGVVGFFIVVKVVKWLRK